MLGNMNISEAVKIMGTGGGTNTKQVIQALKRIGLKVGSEKLLRIPKKWTKPHLCIMHIGFENSRKSHWSLWIGYKNCYHDPALPFIIRDNFYFFSKVKMMSYLEIKGRIKCVAGDCED